MKRRWYLVRQRRTVDSSEDTVKHTGWIFNILQLNVQKPVSQYNILCAVCLSTFWILQTHNIFEIADCQYFCFPFHLSRTRVSIHMWDINMNADVTNQPDANTCCTRVVRSGLDSCWFSVYVAFTNSAQWDILWLRALQRQINLSM